jgi:hypothetical protein
MPSSCGPLYRLFAGLRSGALGHRARLKPGFDACVQYTWNDDSMYPCLNALNDGKYA